MIPDIYINDMSMLKMGWIRENIEFPVPESHRWSCCSGKKCSDQI